MQPIEQQQPQVDSASLHEDIVQSKQDRLAPTTKSLNDRLDAMIAAEDAQKLQQGPLVPQVMQPKPTPPGFATETMRAVVGGPRDAVQNAIDLGADAGNWLNDNLLGLRRDAIGRVNLPEVPANETTGGQVARGLTQFLVPYLGVAKGLRVAGMANTVARGMTAGAITDAAAFDPRAKRLSNMVMDMNDQNPVVGKAMFSYLAADPTDSNAEGRFKNAVEGLGLGTAVEGIFKGVRILKNHFTANGQDPITALKAADEAHLADTAKTAKDTAATAATAPASPVKGKAAQPAPFSRPEVANVAPLKANALPPKVMPKIASAKVKEMMDLAVKGDYSSVTDILKKSDFNMNHIDTPEQVKELIDGFSGVFAKQYDLAKHGVQTHVQLKQLADETGTGLDALKRTYQGTDNLGAAIYGHRTLLAASAEKVNSLARIAMTGDAEAILALRKHVSLHAAIQGQVKGIQTEVARALSQYRISAKSVDLSVSERNALIDAMGGHKANIEFAQKLSDIVDPVKLNAVIRGSALARGKDALFEGWINGLLSSPATHVVNAVGNSLTAVNTVAERYTAAMIGKVLRTGPDAVQTTEVKAQMFGMIEGFKDAVSITNEGLQAMRRAAGQAVTGDTKGARATLTENSNEFGGMWQSAAKNEPVLDSAAYATKPIADDAFTASNFGMDPNSLIGAFTDGLGSLIRLPGRALTTSDELFKTIHYRGELRAQAYRMARGEGLSGDALFTRIATLIENPTPGLRAQAMNSAREGTFTTPLGQKGAALQNLTMNVPGARYIMPFIRTPINLMKYTGVRTPGLNLLAESVRAEFKAGGARRDIMLAKTAMGGTFYALGATLATQGVIVGGGEKNQSAEKLGGALPYSVKVGDKYYAFNRFDPFGAFLGISADMADISGHIGTDESDNIAAMATLAISRNLVSKTYLSGLVEFLATVNSGSEQKWQSFIQRQAATFVPFSALTGAVRREFDPEVKEIWTVLDAVKAKIPGFSESVEPHVNVFGENVHYKGGLGPDIASPIYTSEKSSDPAASEIARLNLDIRSPSRIIGTGSGSSGVQLNPQQYTKYMRFLGKGSNGDNGFKADVTKMVQSQRYQKLPEDPDNNQYVEAKEKSIQMLFDAHKRRAQNLLLASDPQLMSAFRQNMQNKGNALTGRPVLGFPVQQQ